MKGILQALLPLQPFLPLQPLQSALREQAHNATATRTIAIKDSGRGSN